MVTSLVTPSSAGHWAAAAQLVDEYAASLGVPLDFQNFAHERAHLGEEYGPPDGLFLLAQQDDAFVGCGAFRRFSDEQCEMKRLYVSPRGQGRGVGRQLAEALIAEARARGYREMLLDTLPSMDRARALYAALGFEPTAPYRFNPIEGTAYLRIRL